MIIDPEESVCVGLDVLMFMFDNYLHNDELIADGKAERHEQVDVYR